MTLSFLFLIFWNQRHGGLEVVTRGLASLDIVRPAASPPPTTSVSVGGARPKVRHSAGTFPCTRDVKAEPPEPSRSAKRTQPKTQVRWTSRDDWTISGADLILL